MDKETTMRLDLNTYKSELEAELQNILHYWIQHTVDKEHGGFYGKIDFENKVHPQAPKGAVQQARILWAFAAAYRHLGREEYLGIADRAYQYLVNHFVDKTWGGVYWTVDYKGQPLDTKKQIYALAFALYALSEYYQCRKNEVVLQQSIELYQTIVQKSYDAQHGGYIEALTKNWQPLADLRLSDKDANERKTMNTHLHVLEAFAALYRIWKDENLKGHLKDLIHLFGNRIIDKKTHHLHLFFDDEWNPRSNITSYGHDIEAAWLLQEAAEVIDDSELLQAVKEQSIQVAKAAARGLDVDGGLWYEWDGNTLHLVKEKHWWPQSEAMVGFFNTYQNTNDESFLKHSFNSWQFVKKHILDSVGGEWHWGVKEDYTKIEEDKAGLWKCPYHNSRACIEISNRIDNFLKQQKENETF